MKQTDPRPPRDFSVFDQMDTEDLRQLLAQDSCLPENEGSDLDAILYIMGVIEKRGAQQPVDRADAATAWNTFNQYYRPGADGRSLYADEAEDEIDSASPQKPPTVHRRRRTFWRTAGTVAAAVMIVFSATLTSNAVGFDLWGAIATWTGETFSFSQPAVEPADVTPPGVEAGAAGDGVFAGSLQEALTSHGIDTQVAPTWVPAGYELRTVRINEMSVSTIFYAEYWDDDLLLRVRIREATTISSTIFEKDDTPVVIHEAGGREHYIMSNNQSLTAVWAAGPCECSISGFVSEKEMKKMIDSIYK